jgi:hypothetical protein
MHAHKHAMHAPAKEMKVGGTTTPNAKYPYLHIVDSARRTMGKGSTQPTMFGVLGRTKMDPYMTSLQDLVHDTMEGHHPAPVMSDKSVMHHGNTERHNVSAPPKTRIDPQHYGQILFSGANM